MIPWQESQHPRQPEGSPSGGRFALKLHRPFRPGTRKLSETGRVEALLREHKGFVYARVKYYRRAYGTLLRFEDYESAAFLGAVQAARSYNPRLGSFPNWAISFVDGAIREEVRWAQAGVVHVPKDALREEGAPTYTDVNASQPLVTPDDLTRALAAAEEAAAVEQANFRVQRILPILMQHLPERAVTVYLLVEGEGRSQVETADILRVGRATVQRDYQEAVSVVERLKAKGMLKAAVPALRPPRAGLLKDLRNNTWRSAQLHHRLAVLRRHAKGLPPGVLLRARAAAERATREALALDREIAERLLSPRAIPSPSLVIPVFSET
jgi:RNA polymerase sigma factor (sigma-70 family)